MRALALLRGFGYRLPFMAWLPGAGKRDLKADFVAGLTGAVVVLPQGVAFATIAGMPPEYGLYAGMIPAIIAALFGSSKHLVSGPTTAASIVLFSALSVYATPGTPDYVTLALTLTFMVGIMELGLGLARMGALVNFISHSVVVGFTAGAAILICAKQLTNFFGVTIPRGGHLPEILSAFWANIGTVNGYITAVSLITLFSGLLFKRLLPQIPYMLGAMLTGALAAQLLNAGFGAEQTGITMVGALPAGLPPLSAPDLTLENIKNLAPSALAVTLFALTEAVSIGRSLAAKGGYRINGNQEFIGQGLSNLFGAFFSGYVATGSFNRSGLNYQAGARTPLAAVFAGLLLMLIIIPVAPLIAYLPTASMAGILFLVAWGLIDFKEMRHIVTTSKTETTVLLVTFLGALFLELEFAIFAGVMLSLVLYLEKVSRPKVLVRTPDPRIYKRAFSSDPDLPQCPQTLILRVEGSLFFGSTNYFLEQLDKLRAQRPEQKQLAIIAAGISFVDLQGGEALASEAERRRREGGNLYLINVKEGLWDSLDRYGFLDRIGERNIFESKTAAIHAVFQKMNKDTCAECKARVFRECGPSRAKWDQDEQLDYKRVEVPLS